MPDDKVQKELIDTGASDQPKYRAGPNEGNRAPFVAETEGGVAQQSIFDGKGNETIVVTTTNEDGVRKQGTGATAAEAEKDARSTKESIGEGFFPSHRPGETIIPKRGH